MNIQLRHHQLINPSLPIQQISKTHPFPCTFLMIMRVSGAKLPN